MVAVTMISMIGMTTLLALFIYGSYNRERIMKSVGENTMYVIGIMINQGITSINPLKIVNGNLLPILQ